jgi:hypothetical protein
MIPVPDAAARALVVSGTVSTLRGIVERDQHGQQALHRLWTGSLCYPLLESAYSNACPRIAPSPWPARDEPHRFGRHAAINPRIQV